LSDKENIILAALLHDIGKFIYRSQDSYNQRKFTHQEMGRDWAKQEGLPEEVVRVIERHHRMEKGHYKYNLLSLEAYSDSTYIANMIKLIACADNTSSGMERGGDEGEGGHFDMLTGLRSVLASVSLEESESKPKESQLKDRNVIWEAKNIKDRPYSATDEREFSKYGNFYKEQWTHFQQEFKGIKESLNEENLLCLLQKYTMQIPEYTKVIDGQAPDTSLFHHLKTTAAMAWCNYKYITEEKLGDAALWRSQDLNDLIYDSKEEKYLLVGGDLSGIQQFIYTLTSKEALKTVRGRSFYLELLMEAVVQRLVERLDLCASCIVYNGGGGFYLLAPNTRRVLEGLDREKRRINEWLYGRFGLSLYLAIAYLPLKGADFDRQEGSLGEVWGKLRELNGKEKGQKWAFMFTDRYDELFNPRVCEDECIICHQPVAGKEKCDVCSRMIEIGEKLVAGESNALLREPGGQKLYQVKDTSDYDIEILDEYFYSFKKPDKAEDIMRIYLLEELWQLQPGYTVKNFPAAIYVHQKDLEKLVEDATGYKKLGVLRMDVDRLGKIFSSGLKGRTTFARLNDLSERLNLYFKYYLPWLIENRVESPLTFNPLKKYNAVNLIYSGGDDLFMLGTWDSVLDVAWMIYADFKRYAGYNPDISLSGGYVLADEKMAFYRMAEAAGDEEKKAKDSGRNSLALFGQALKWSSINRLSGADREGSTLAGVMHLLSRDIQFEGDRAKCRDLSKSFIHKLQRLVEEWQGGEREEDRESAEERYWVIPKIYYLFAREAKQKGKPLITVALKEDVLSRLLMPALIIVDYLTRGGGDR